MCSGLSGIVEGGLDVEDRSKRGSGVADKASDQLLLCPPHQSSSCGNPGGADATAADAALVAAVTTPRAEPDTGSVISGACFGTSFGDVSSGVHTRISDEIVRPGQQLACASSTGGSGDSH